MKKRLSYLLLAVLLLICLFIAAFYAVMRSQYATQVVNEALAQISSQPMQVEQAEFTPPLQLTLHGLTIGDDTPLYLPKVELWLHPSLPNRQVWRFDAIVIEQANLNLSQPAWTVLRQFEITQLAFKQSELVATDWSARGVNLQIDQPTWQDEQQVLPYGDMQFSAEQLYVDGHALDNLLIDARYQAENSTVYGASFSWNGAQISGQAEQYPQGWSLINVTIDKLNLDDSQPIDTWLQQLDKTGWIRDINSLDILKSNLTYQGVRVVNLDLSAEKITPSQSLWQQDNGYLSFDADSINYQNQQWVEPRATFNFSPNQIEVAELDSDWHQGRLQLQGVFTPGSMHLKQLSLSGVKWLEEAQYDLINAWHWSQSIQNLTIDKLDVNNLQIIQLNQKPFWQISGLNIDATDLVLKQQGELGFWQGNLIASANSASIDKHLTTQAAIEMNAEQKKWHLTRLFVPLDQGYIEAEGFWDRSKLSAPWQLNITMDGLPLESNVATNKQPIHINALAEVHAELSGLAGDYSMLAHSLSGKVSAALRQGYITIGQHGKQSQLEQNFELDNLSIDADRGRITIQSPTLKQGMQAAGNIDLTQPSLATLLLQYNSECQRLQWDVAANIYQLLNTCPIEETESAQTSNLESSIDL
ncbi:hypothetical protein VII00023_14428 [Vibrio ichthyoenteri ATCC 700023]|uniref:AsmA domain-containing protein n=1 Tax=Vibrio ichthyoenteri ATCC 700023 TaxID=870968 RepID=F9S5D8_9VIBR|nr:AsmA family protein [Vibrio ichthyoenteri]EGU35880.1 hypothetical protein VII00023_14428 [Vibrio ichthyoenteri ATCC 700023]